MTVPVKKEKKVPATKVHWSPDFTTQIMRVAECGGTLAQMYQSIGISTTTALRLRKEDPEAEEAFSKAVVASQAWWERQGVENLENRTYNSRLFEIMTRRFAEFQQPKDNNKVEVKNEVVIDFSGEVQKLIQSLKDVN